MGAIDNIQIDYTASPTLARFHESNAFVRGIRGPIGSGKSVGCCVEIFARAARQRPGKDGIRRSRWAIVRNTYPELKSTTIKTWQDWFPDSICPIVYDAPIRGLLRVGDIHLELIFLALDRPKDVKKLLSLELTGCWINEAREVPKSVLDAAAGRVGRYPAKRDGGASWSGVIMDTNPPDDSHWWYTAAEVERPQGWEFWSQPPALIKRKGVPIYDPNPAAENVENHALGFDYWLRQIAGKKEEWIKVYILGQYGTVLDGRLVYSEYRDDYHCAGDILEPMRGLPLLLGWDYGRTPACIVLQLTPRGQLRVLDEMVIDAAGEGMGIRMFTREVVKPRLANKYTGMTIGASWGDPSGVAKDGNDESCFDIQAQEGIPTVGSNSNDPQVRQDAVSRYLMANVDSEPGFLLSPNCVFLRKGFLGGYRFTRVQVSGEERYRDVPEKNRYSHPHDALQYGSQAAHGAVVVAPRAQARPVSARPSAGWT